MPLRALVLLLAVQVPAIGFGSVLFGDHEPVVGPPSFSGPVTVVRNTLGAVARDDGIQFTGDLFFEPLAAGPLTITIPLERTFQSDGRHFDARATLVGNAFLAPGDTVVHRTMTTVDGVAGESMVDGIGVNPQFHWFRGVGPTADLVVGPGDHVLRGTVVANLTITEPGRLERLQYPGRFTINPGEVVPTPVPEPAGLLIWAVAAATLAWLGPVFSLKPSHADWYCRR